MTATLPSNNGEAQFVIELSAPAEYACDAGYESSIHLHGQHWDGEHSFPFATSISGLWLRAEDLTALREHIVRWLRQPMDCLLAEDLSADFQLARLPGQSVHVRFGSRPDMHSDLNPIVTILFSSGALQGEFHFVTDQSCLGLFTKELSGDLVSANETAT